MSGAPHDKKSQISRLLAQVKELSDAGEPIDIAVLASQFPELAEQVSDLVSVSEQTKPPSDSTPTGSWSGQPEHMPEFIGRYRVLRRLGAGGMGTVYEAEDPNLSRRVAVKVPFMDRTAERPEVAARFLRESRAAAGVHHPNVCPIFDTGVQNGAPFAVMGLIVGGSLADKIRSEGLFEPAPAAELVIQIAEGLGAIHSRGIIHRDLKPANILLDDSSGTPVPKITDFGLARTTDIVSDLTRTGGLLGTPAYMAPEQACGELDRVGPATDIYALGVVLYQMLAGRLPFEGLPLAVLAKVREVVAPNLSELRPGIDPRLATIVARAMAKRPEDRYHIARDFADDLRRWLNNRMASSFALPKPTPGRRWNLKHTAVALMFLVVGVVVWSYFGLRLASVSQLSSRPENELEEPGGDATLAPRVHIHWDLNEGGSNRRVELPFVIAVMANLSGTPTKKVNPLRDRRFLTIDNNNLEQVFRQTAPRLTYSVPDPISGDATSLNFDYMFLRLEDFSPGAVAAHVPELNAELIRRESLDNRQAELDTGRQADPEGKLERDLVAQKAALDKNLSARVAAVMHHPDFRKLEATWRGLNYLVSMVKTNEQLQIRIFNTSKSELAKDLEKAAEADQSTIFKKIYVEEFGVIGGTPAGLLIGDFEFNVASS